MFKAVSMVSDVVNILDWCTNIGTSAMLYNNTNKAKKTLLYCSIGMSAIAIGVSVAQSRMIMKNSKKIEDNIRDAILRNQS